MTLAPFAWMVLASFKSLPDVESLRPLPQQGWHPGNYAIVLRLKTDPISDQYIPIHYGRYYFNSVFVASWVTFLTCITSAMAGFAFSRLRWPGRDVVFKVYLSTMMIPVVVTIIPVYALMVKLHLLDTYVALVVPASFSAFGTFLLRQFMLTIHPALDESASIDGATPWQVFSQIIVPLARPGLIALAIFTFLGNYMSFIWPLIMVTRDHLRTLPVGLLYFDSLYNKQTNLVMAASVMNIVPLIVLFVVTQKFLVKGIQLGAVKG